jgi:hypothetical protein
MVSLSGCWWASCSQGLDDVEEDDCLTHESASKGRIGPPMVSHHDTTFFGELPMRSNLTGGIVAGLIAGVMFGIMMTMMQAPTPSGGGMPMMAMVAQVVGSSSLAVGWLYHLFNSAVIGGLFGWFLGSKAGGFGSGIGWGAGYGVIWWVLGGLIMMPVFLGMPAFAPLRMPMMRPVAFASLMGHVMFGVILGAAFVLLRRTAGSASLGSA